MEGKINYTRQKSNRFWQFWLQINIREYSQALGWTGIMWVEILLLTILLTFFFKTIVFAGAAIFTGILYWMTSVFLRKTIL
jgi:hypothetical protein